MISPSEEFLQALKEKGRRETLKEVLDTLVQKWNTMTQEEQERFSKLLAG